MNVSKEGIALERIFEKVSLFWQIGDGDSNLAVTTNLADAMSLLDLSIYEYPEKEPTVKYLLSHSVADILAGKNAEMKPVAISLLSSGTMIIEFETATRLHIDNLFALKRAEGVVIEATEITRDDLSPEDAVTLWSVEIGYEKDTGNTMITHYANGERCAKVVFDFDDEFTE